MSTVRAHRRPQAAADRLASLEERADSHDELHATKIAPMVDQVGEMYELLTRWRNINWFFVKIGAYVGGALGAIAVLLTIIDRAKGLFGH